MTLRPFVAKTRIIPVLTVLALLAFPVSVARADSNIKTIGNCQRISEPGSYALHKAITATASDLIRVFTFDPAVNRQACIVIGADFVTLDLQGYTITGPGDDNDNSVEINGISTDFFSTGFPFPRGIKVHSGAVTNFERGIFLRGPGNTVEHINASYNSSFGIFVDGNATYNDPVNDTPGFFSGGGGDPALRNGHRIVGNTANRSRRGIVINCPAVVLENVASGNAVVDISADPVTCTRFANNPAP